MANREFRKRQREFGKRKRRNTDERAKHAEQMRRQREKEKQKPGPKPTLTPKELERNARKLRRFRRNAALKRKHLLEKSSVQLKFNFVTFLALLLKTILNQLPNNSLFPLFYQSVKRFEGHYYEMQRKLKFYKSLLSNRTKVKHLLFCYMEIYKNFRRLHSEQTLN